MAAALEAIGVKHSHELGYGDGCCDESIRDEVVTKLADIITKEQPDSIITFGFTGSTGHPDHIAACNWTTLAVKQANLKRAPKIYHSVHSRDWYNQGGKAFADQFNVFFNIPVPPLVEDAKADILLDLKGKYCERKLQAMRAHASQTTIMFENATPEALKNFACVEAFLLEQNDQIGR